MLLGGAVNLRIGAEGTSDRHRRLQLHPRDRTPKGALPGATTRRTWCPTANTSRCVACSSRSACRASWRVRSISLPGPGPRTVDLGDWGRAGMQICYEIVFSGEVVDRAHRPDYIFNPSNDGWFGRWGPPQHLAQARMRAIEEGLPVLRATTTGISAVIAANERYVLCMYWFGWSSSR